MTEDPSDVITFNLKEEIARMEDRQCELVSQRDEAEEQRDALLRGCQAAIAYLADPPSVFKENRDEAARLINAAIAKATGNL